MSKDLKEKNLQLAENLRSGLFSERPTIKEAYTYAEKVIEAMHPEDIMPAYTAIHVLLNTISNKMKEINE